MTENDPDAPFMPIVESLLKYPLDSREFLDAAEVAGPAELAEARRQLQQNVRFELLEKAAVTARMDQLLARHPEWRGDQ
jgi:hypothetical protein